MFFTNHILKFKYQPAHFTVKQQIWMTMATLEIKHVYIFQSYLTLPPPWRWRQY